MGKFGFFSHESRDGSEFWARVKRWYGPDGYRSWSVGENLLWSSAAQCERRSSCGWTAPGTARTSSPGAGARSGCRQSPFPAAPGVFGGRDVVIITSDFGTRT